MRPFAARALTRNPSRRTRFRLVIMRQSTRYRSMIEVRSASVVPRAKKSRMSRRLAASSTKG